MLSRIHFSTDKAMIGETIKKQKAVKIELVYLGSNTYNVKAINIEDNKTIINKQVEYPLIKGNSRKSYAKLRDFAMNVIENKPLNYNRK